MRCASGASPTSTCRRRRSASGRRSTRRTGRIDLTQTLADGLFNYLFWRRPAHAELCLARLVGGEAGRLQAPMIVGRGRAGERRGGLQGTLDAASVGGIAFLVLLGEDVAATLHEAEHHVERPRIADELSCGLVRAVSLTGWLP